MFKPLKTGYNKACLQFLKENPGRIVTRYDFCGLFPTAYHKVYTMLHAASAFRAKGIYPFNPSIIQEVLDHSLFLIYQVRKATVNLNNIGHLTKDIEAESDPTSTSADCTVPCASGMFVRVI